MRRFTLFLGTACLALIPVIASAATSPAAPTPAASAAVAPAAAPATAAQTVPSPFNDAQTAAIKDIIKSYLSKENPQVLVDGLQELQKRESADNDAKSKVALDNDHDKVFNDATSPIGGNPKGTVTVVEFFDYQCGYCKMSEPHIERLLKENKQVKFIYKDYPILGPSSTLAAKAALAAAKQGKYIQYHDALMAAGFSHGQRPADDEKTVYETAKNIGLNIDKLKKDMEDPAIDKQVQDNVALGMEIGARGTPTFVIGDAIYPGAMEYDQLKKTVDDQAAKKP